MKVKSSQQCQSAQHDLQTNQAYFHLFIKFCILPAGNNHIGFWVSVVLSCPRQLLDAHFKLFFKVHLSLVLFLFALLLVALLLVALLLFTLLLVYLDVLQICLLFDLVLVALLLQLALRVDGKAGKRLRRKKSPILNLWKTAAGATAVEGRAVAAAVEEHLRT